MTRPLLIPFCRLVKRKLNRPETEVEGFVNTAREFFAMMEAWDEMMATGLVEPPKEMRRNEA